MAIATDGFIDNAKEFIIAWDFDGTMTLANDFPRLGRLRPYTYEVFATLSLFNVKNIVWTCRDAEDVQPLREYLVEHSIAFDDINSSIRYAPFHYEARKIYAHLYVDDRAYGWVDSKDIMIKVMKKIMRDIIGLPPVLTIILANKVRRHDMDGIIKTVDKYFAKER